MRSLLREPLFHFLLLGAALFAAYALLHRERNLQPDEVVVTTGEIENLAAKFARFRQRPPTAEELKGLIDEQVRDEISSREAVKLGLDRNDSVIRRHLRQKLEFVAADLSVSEEPTDAELASRLAQRADDYRLEPRFTFRHVYVDPGKRGDRFDDDVSKLLEELKRAGADADTSQHGDPILLPREIADLPASAVASQFGPEFAKALEALPCGEWAGPIRSGFGAHLVLLASRAEGRLPALAEVRERIVHDVLRDRRLEADRRFQDGLLAKYRVTIQWPSESSLGAEKKLEKHP